MSIKPTINVVFVFNVDAELEANGAVEVVEFAGCVGKLLSEVGTAEDSDKEDVIGC